MPLDGEYEPSPTAWVRKQADLYESSNGTKGTTLQGVPVILMTTRGARTGKLRRVPLMRVEHQGVYAVVASLGGSPKNPLWYYNLLADPHVELRDRETVQDLRARQVGGEEKAAWWDRAVAVWPAYADYQRKTDRELPVFVLEPIRD